MTLDIDFSPQTEAWICAEAARRGVKLEEVIKSMVDTKSHGPSPKTEADRMAAIARIDAWLKESSNVDPEVAKGANDEYLEFRRQLIANRSESQIPLEAS